jgi:hypothetical protein
MAKEFGTGKEFTFLRLNSKGELYIGSKDPKEGYVEVPLNDGKVTYQKAFRSTDYGKVIFLGINEKNFDSGKVKYVEISIQSDDRENAVDVVQLPLRNSKNGLTDEVKKLIAILPSLDYSKPIIISSNREKNQRGYVDKVLYFRYKAEEGQEKDTPIKFSLKFGEKGNVPMFLLEEDPIEAGKKTLNYKDQDAFLSKVLLYELKRYADFKEGNVYTSDFYKEWETEGEAATAQTTPQTTTPVVETKKPEENPFAANALEEDNDSPF